MCLVFYSFPQKEEFRCLALIPACCIKGFLIHCSLSSAATSTGRHSMKTQFLKQRGRSSSNNSNSLRKVGTLEGMVYGVFMGECPPLPWQHHANVFVLPSVALVFKRQSDVPRKGCVWPSQKVQKRRKSKLCHLNIEGFNLVEQERFFFMCPLFLESF